MKTLEPMVISGREVLPLVEGGKGISISNGESAGAWVAAGAVGTASAVNADSFDRQGQLVKQVYHCKTRRLRHEELIAYAIQGGISQTQIAHEISGGKGPLHLNFLWEAGGTTSILQAILEGAKGLVHGITCGAGMPFRLADIASRYKVYYYPII
ncbi:MAG: nitronate monooxygenase, partial [Rhodospirillales bacterium]|nr:nitronate monooxygenase [Rhodospirillales bacterium]